jgi:hypothetical protein
MAIVPAGKLKIMEAQSFTSPHTGFSMGEQTMSDIQPGNENVNDAAQQAQDSAGVQDEDMKSALDVVDEDEITYDDVNKGPVLGDDVDAGPDSINEPIIDGKKTLSDFIFKKLEEFGYPGRRLYEFKAKFVREDVSPDGAKDIKVEIPDKSYPDEQGNVQTIETDDLGSLVREVESLFDLYFNGASRAEGKWTINFVSTKPNDKNEEEMIERDNLDEVYGNPKGTKRTINKNKATNASTIKELIKDNKDNAIKKLNEIFNILGEDHDS